MKDKIIFLSFLFTFCCCCCTCYADWFDNAKDREVRSEKIIQKVIKKNKLKKSGKFLTIETLVSTWWWGIYILKDLKCLESQNIPQFRYLCEGALKRHGGSGFDCETCSGTVTAMGKHYYFQVGRVVKVTWFIGGLQSELTSNYLVIKSGDMSIQFGIPMTMPHWYSMYCSNMPLVTEQAITVINVNIPTAANREYLQKNKQTKAIKIRKNEMIQIVNSLWDKHPQLNAWQLANYIFLNSNKLFWNLRR